MNVFDTLNPDKQLEIHERTQLLVKALWREAASFLIEHSIPTDDSGLSNGWDLSQRQETRIVSKGTSMRGSEHDITELDGESGLRLLTDGNVVSFRRGSTDTANNKNIDYFHAFPGGGNPAIWYRNLSKFISTRVKSTQWMHNSPE